jgi:hypothetical protein
MTTKKRALLALGLVLPLAAGMYLGIQFVAG